MLSFIAVVAAQVDWKLINYLLEQITAITVWSHLCLREMYDSTYYLNISFKEEDFFVAERECMLTCKAKI
jgi:ABC-type uncharacterized transport system substrate-binding protein